MSSSTSSSNKKRKPFRLYSAGFLGFIVLFAVAETLVFRNVYFYGMEYRSFVGQFAELDYSFHHSGSEKVETAIFGDSMSKDALRPDLLAEASGLDPGTIFNFSLSGGKAFEIYHTYRKYADRLPNLKEAIVVVSEHQINSYNMANDPKFRFYARLGDRLRVLNKDNYGELLLGWVSKGFDMRSVWSKLVQSYNKNTLPKKPIAEVAQPGGLRAETMKVDNGLTPAYAKERTDSWFEQYDPDGLQTVAFESLLCDLHARGVRIVILQLPRSELFEQAVQRHYAAEEKEYLNIVTSLAEKYGAEFEVMSNEGLELEKHYRDTNHVNPKGAEIVSRRVAEEWLK